MQKPHPQTSVWNLLYFEFNMPEGFRLVFSYGICASFARGGPVWHKKFSVPFNRHSIDGDVSLSVYSEKRPKMYRLMRLVLTTTGLIFSFMAMTLHAAIMTFNVDLSGIDPPSGHNLRVFGTLTVDPVLPILASNTHSSLFFQHNVDPNRSPFFTKFCYVNRCVVLVSSQWRSLY